MSQNYVHTDDIDAVKTEYPGSAAIVESDGGYTVMDTMDDYRIWCGQCTEEQPNLAW